MRIATITTGEAGMRNQAKGLAARLSDDNIDFIIKPNWPWNKLPANWVPSAVLELPDLQASDVLITCGRRSASYAIALKRKFPKLFTVNIQDPQIPTRYFDLVVPMQHDHCSGDNVFPVQTALHNLSEDKLLTAPQAFQQQLAKLPIKKVAFILGGNTRNYQFTQENFDQLMNALEYFIGQGFGVLLTTARRTPESIVSALKQIKKPNLWIYLGEGDNPYHCFLQQAECFIVTSDSVSMMSEAMYTGKPTYLISLHGRSRRLDKFKQTCLDQGWIRIWQGQYERYQYQAQDSVQQVADHINSLLK